MLYVYVYGAVESDLRLIKLSKLTDSNLHDPRRAMLSDPSVRNGQRMQIQSRRIMDKLTSHSLVSVGEEPVMTCALLVAARAMKRRAAARQRMMSRC